MLQIGNWYTQYSAGYWQLLALYPKYADADYLGEKVQWKKGDCLGNWAVVKKAFTGKMKKSILVECVDSSHLKPVSPETEAEISMFFAEHPDYFAKFQASGDMPQPYVSVQWANFTDAEAEKMKSILASLPSTFTGDEFLAHISDLRRCFTNPPGTHLIRLFSYPWQLTEQFDPIFVGVEIVEGK